MSFRYAPTLNFSSLKESRASVLVLIASQRKGSSIACEFNLRSMKSQVAWISLSRSVLLCEVAACSDLAWFSCGSNNRGRSSLSLCCRVSQFKNLSSGLKIRVFDLCESVQICRIFSELCRYVQIRKKSLIRNSINCHSDVKHRDLQIFIELKNDQIISITYSELPPSTKNTPTNLIPEIVQHQHFINTYTKPEGCHMSNFLCQSEIHMAKEPLKVQQPLLESSSEMNKLRCITNTAHSPVTKITVMGTNFFSREFRVIESDN